ncbi:S41 family peptidase [uncultured Tenacibaculum sp.]|uniref:S41 family peptidase n=1 Tax=uncultured Tenacibaculum sp. TaxID=174713 RepID=UPI002634F8FC|nr:S41 family peptidase [uncultured Tenacibaculum sp.]
MKKPIRVFTKLLLITVFIISCNSKTEQKKSIAEAISVLPNATIKETIAYYYKLKEEYPTKYNFEKENELNTLGYQYLSNGKVSEAIEIFKLLVSEFPKSSNPYDSLGEAYKIAGNNELAIKNYEKSLALNSKNINAEDIINKLKYSKYDATRFGKKYKIKEYKDDLDELGRRLSEVNPNVYKFISKKDFWSAIESKKELITESTTFSNFLWHCSEIIANINCSHTSMGYFNQERKLIPIELRFPLEVKMINNKLYVSNSLINKEKVNLKDEIVAINGKSIKVIKLEIFKHISSQGNIETYKKNFLNAHSTSIIPYALGFPKSYKILLKGATNSIELNPLTNYQNNFQKLPNYLCQETLCLNYSKDKKTAFMTIRSFAYYGKRFKKFKAFIDNSFDSMAKIKIKNLVIDIRGNGGGPSDAGIYLLKYLSQTPFTYFSSSQFSESLDEIQPFSNNFKGTTYITMDGNGGSTTGHFMSLVKYLKLATLIGEELGSNQFCTGGQKRLRLPNTGVIYSVARNTYITTATSFPIDRGIMPDHEITQSIDDYVNDIDTVMEYTLSLLQKKDK